MTLALLLVFGLLGLGYWLRVKVRLLHLIYVPASIVAGLIGLLLVQLALLAQSGSSHVFGELTTDIVDQLSSWPSWLIAVVFAGMFLERRSRSLQDSLRLAGREGIVVWIIVVGQTALGLLATWLLIQPFYDVPNSFGMLIETGFAGGHGTAGAMGDVFASEAVGLEGGLALGTFMATVGLVFSVLSGVVYVNIAIRCGWTRPGSTVNVSSSEQVSQEPTAIARGTTQADIIDPLLFQAIPLAFAFAIGLGCQFAVTSAAKATDVWMNSDDDQSSTTEEQAVQSIATKETRAESALSARTSFSGILGSFPLFIYTMIGGLFVRRVMEAMRIAHLIDVGSMQRFSGAAMDLLVVSAITSLSIRAVAGVFIPLLILLAVAFVWTAFCLLYVGRRLLPRDYWFELGIINYGMSTGTTATGFVLLKMIDRDLDSGAAENYALAAPLSSPFIGGGIVTFSLPLLLLERVPIAASSLGMCAIVVALFVIGRFWAQRSDDAVS